MIRKLFTIRTFGWNAIHFPWFTHLTSGASIPSSLSFVVHAVIYLALLLQILLGAAERLAFQPRPQNLKLKTAPTCSRRPH